MELKKRVKYYNLKQLHLNIYKCIFCLHVNLKSSSPFSFLCLFSELMTSTKEKLVFDICSCVNSP